MIAEQYKIMPASVPAHCPLQELGQLEISTTPFYHPILPLLIDSDQATLDRPGGTHPPRLAYPENTQSQVEMAAEFYRRSFGQISPHSQNSFHSPILTASVRSFAVSWARYTSDLQAVGRLTHHKIRLKESSIQPSATLQFWLSKA